MGFEMNDLNYHYVSPKRSCRCPCPENLQQTQLGMDWGLNIHMPTTDPYVKQKRTIHQKKKKKCKNRTTIGEMITCHERLQDIS